MPPSRIYIGLLSIEPSAIAKLNQKHSITEDQVRERIEYPAQIDAAFEDHPEHGARWIALVPAPGGRLLFAALDPMPEWEGENADTWHLRTAYWVT